jgi:hypothetical protein
MEEGIAIATGLKHKIHHFLSTLVGDYLNEVWWHKDHRIIESGEWRFLAL